MDRSLISSTLTSSRFHRNLASLLIAMINSRSFKLPSSDLRSIASNARSAASTTFRSPSIHNFANSFNNSRRASGVPVSFRAESLLAISTYLNRRRSAISHRFPTSQAIEPARTGQKRLNVAVTRPSRTVPTRPTGSAAQVRAVCAGEARRPRGLSPRYARGPSRSSRRAR